MGGRGSTSGGGGGGGRTRSQHLADMTREDAIQQLKKDAPRMDAETLYREIQDFTGEEFAAVRAAQMGQDAGYPLKSQAELAKVGDDIEAYIAAAPKWGDKPLYRGYLALTDWGGTTPEQMQQTIAAKGTISMNGTSSWSSSASVAGSFANSSMRSFFDADGEEYDGGFASYVFVSSGTRKGTSIRHLSVEPSQNEVIVSKSARFRPVSMTRSGQHYIVQVEEV